jgi:hypothetical protein
LHNLERIERSCLPGKLYINEDVESISGPANLTCLGLLPLESLENFEKEAFWGLASRLEDCFADYRDLRNQVEFRCDTGKNARDSNW